jgi:23S rRNA (uridine2552-2'-O)-methyltransferase
MSDKKPRSSGHSSTLRVPGRARKSSATPGGKLAKDDAEAPQRMRTQTVSLRTARGRTTAQQKWLARQLNDPYVQAAHKQGWRSRAAFKLIELDDKFGLIRPGMRVVDLGAAPGGWTQVLVKRGAAQVVGVDLLPVDPVPGAEIIEGDFTDPDMATTLTTMLGGKVDLVVSDMAPNTTGHGPTDHIRIIGLTEEALHFAFEILAEGGGVRCQGVSGWVRKSHAGYPEAGILPCASRQAASQP